MVNICTFGHELVRRLFACMSLNCCALWPSYAVFGSQKVAMNWRE
jgi:hypothetical protein